MFLKFDIESCKDCYSCLRHCPVKAISFKNNKAEIIEDQCILCGKCVHVCPQNAKKVSSDIENVKDLLSKNDHNVALIVAPSFVSNFDVFSFASFAKACKQLGFAYVEEVALGAKYVTREYKRLLDEGKYKVLISSCCPASNDYLRMCFPQAIKYLAPVITPMVATARILKKKISQDLKIVFVGPCLAKKKEALEFKEVDFALTFEEISQMFKEKNIVFEDLVDEGLIDNPARYYPINRGIIKSFADDLPKNYDSISIDGEEEIKETLANINELDHMFIEMNMCEGGCINGPCKTSNTSFIKDNAKLRAFVKDAKSESDFENVDIDMSCTFSPKEISKKIPSEEEIRKILANISKFKKEDEINCGACGYATCREKAIAVFNGTADPEFCMPYLKNKAESISNEIIEHTPNGIITINKDGYLLDVNSRAREYLSLTENVVGKYFQDVLDLPELLIALNEEKSIPSVIVFNSEGNMYFDVSITYVKDQKIAFAIYKDVTTETLNEEKMKSLRQNMIKVTDEVINQQMMAVQEIASLLGESTAKAKIALINFKNTLKDNE